MVQRTPRGCGRHDCTQLKFLRLNRSRNGTLYQAGYGGICHRPILSMITVRISTQHTLAIAYVSRIGCNAGKSGWQRLVKGEEREEAAICHSRGGFGQCLTHYSSQNGDPWPHPPRGLHWQSHALPQILPITPARSLPGTSTSGRRSGAWAAQINIAVGCTWDVLGEI